MSGVLLKEVETDSRQGKRTWYPRQGEDTPPNATKNYQEGTLTPGHNSANGSLGAVGVGIMSRPKKRGPKHKALPQEVVTKLSGEGMSSKAIAARLRAEGITVSSKTIQRLLAGQRALVVL